MRDISGFGFLTSIALLFKAFSSGCSALTGVEAVSDAVPIFKDPCVKTANRVLYLLGGVIIFIFGGTALLAMKLRVCPILGGETVLSQMAHCIFGSSFLYYALQIFTSLILLLAANTAYSGLPTLLSILARDSYVPRQFAQRGAKLSFSNGIIFIWALASLIIVIFHAETHSIIPLYAVGAFISFTLSQAGMFAKWVKNKPKGWQIRALINGFGAIVTVVVGFIVLVSKFTHGAWILMVMIPSLMALMLGIHKHYSSISMEIDKDEFNRIYHKETAPGEKPMLVLMNRLTKSGVKALNYANSMSHNVTVLCVAENKETAADLKKRWEEFGIKVNLEIIFAPFRNIIEPIEEYLKSVESELKEHNKLTVVMTKFVSEHWYDRFLHNQTTFFLQRELSNHRNIATVLIPYRYADRKLAPTPAKLVPKPA
jgi:hypothetical protein